MNRSVSYLHTLTIEKLQSLKEPVFITERNNQPFTVLLPYRKYMELQDKLIAAEVAIQDLEADQV